ncbi:Glutamyl-tRNA(Gln) amidotransferase subunit A [Methanimicrococcus sp. At1]|uniref:Glutamyl-tRNA(Gln) amidotransferase subunit A n=1 Tax=Methanimicrococcus hacksteinii TaxID=3028293 RepID=A0ABU3VR92_9EURY|nr:amidase family protein [Methanimicrococcus sp. At1]MDV0445934.1 Glutamyl-tRNA(Gln) amidotransferase subunit A [Methanimicrococcus sp. At1]
MTKDIAAFKAAGSKAAAESLEKIKKDDSGIFITVCENAESAESGPLAGVPIALSDNISTKDVETTCASQIMKGYVPPFSGKAVDDLQKAGAVLIGKTNMAEFGILGAASAYGPVKNPRDKTKKGGPSGSAAAVAAGFVPAAVCSDAGGLLRVSASYCGTPAFKPTYGAVSRFGLIYYTGSLDQIGVTATSVSDIVTVMDVISGNDSRDTTSLPGTMNYSAKIKSGDKPLDGVQIGIPEEFLEGVSADVMKTFEESVAVFEKLGAACKKFSLKTAKYMQAVHDIISAGESSAMLAKFDGTRFGPRVEADNWHEMIARTRALFGPVAERRIMLGIYMLMAGQYNDYYMKSMQTRTLILEEFESVFKEFDLLISPTAKDVAPDLGGACGGGCDIELSSYSAAIAGADLAGLPAATVPCGFVGNLPAGLQIIGGFQKDADVIAAAAAFENATDFIKFPEAI